MTKVRTTAITSNILIKQAVDLLEAARHQAVRNTNSLMVFTYFHLGRLIVEHEQGGNTKAVYGQETIKQLSKELCKKFGNGFSQRNLEQIRTFFLIYRNRQKKLPIPQTPSAKSSLKSETAFQASFAEVFPLSWSHYVALCRIKDTAERSFYEIEVTQGNWSVRELQRQINSGLFERLTLSKDKKSVKEFARKGQLVEKPEDVLKNPYILEFLGLEEKNSYTESDLEKAIINKIEHFLLEMGKGFLFQGRQVRFSLDGEDFFVDLVLYNRLLQCFVLVDLKIGKLKHQDIGQMQMYVNYYDRYIRTKSEKATVGIIICKDKSDAVIEITLPENNRTIFAKEYKLYLPTKAELKRIVE
ncbi:PDDEXK nuclease domain-containing protein [Chitinophaga sp. CC14]|uniref:PDDEXK nuclease domain-containing protein n=1 Tax=Chitinophaga sp. CC14 TaxID=3029199 RepID=UPI003B7934B1